MGVPKRGVAGLSVEQAAGLRIAVEHGERAQGRQALGGCQRNLYCGVN